MALWRAVLFQVRGVVDTVGSVLGAYQASDLNEEELEELRMLTGFPPAEIHRLRKEFLRYAPERTHISIEDFMSIPVVSTPYPAQPVTTSFTVGPDASVLRYFRLIFRVLSLEERLYMRKGGRGRLD
jgi:hypothetical protein